MSAPGPDLAALHPGTLDCVHCGLCLPSCPTYRETGRETSSPRGRIALMRGVAEGAIELDDVVAGEMSLCLGCRACETACPSGVAYGSLLERARSAVADAGLRGTPAQRLERLALRHVLPHRRRLGALIALLGVAQRLGLDRALRPLLPARLRDAHGLLPPIPPAAARRRLPAVTPAEGTRRGRVAVFEGCIMPELFGPVNAATVRVLAAHGFDVVVPPAQRCCGALQAHAGDLATARRLAHHNARAFAAPDAGLADVDAVIVNSAGCGAALRELPHWIGEEGARLAGRVRDVCEWLDEAGPRPPAGRSEGARPEAGRFDARVCYDDPCHLVHGQGVSDAPRRLLTAVPGLELVAHDDPAACCGAAGTYNLMEPAMSRAVLARKVEALLAARPDVVASGNPGCLMQLRAGLAAAGAGVRVLHPVEILDAALGAAAGRRRAEA